MGNRTLVVEPGPTIGAPEKASGRAAHATGGARFDWLMAGLGAWLLGGLYLDGWAHIHVPALETFFTPWHAVLYSGYLAGAAALMVTFCRNRRRGAPRSSALPAGYRLSLVGVFIFFFAGVADMLWHVVFGIEDGVEGLISPSHLALAVGGGLMVTGPLRAGLRARPASGGSWLSRMPMVVSLTLFVSLLTFFTEYASPYGATWVAKTPGGMVFLHQSVGLAGFLVQPVVLMGPVMFVLRRRPLPLGSLTVLLSLNVALMAIIHDKFLDTGPYPLIGAAVLAGLAADILLGWLRPSSDRPLAFRAVAFLVPALQYLFYFLAVMLWANVTWSVHLWTGAIVIAGGVGWLLSYLALAPGVTRDAGLPESDWSGQVNARRGSAR
jgi:hypothetical protein